MGPEVISAAISTAVPIFLKLVRGAAGRFDYGTSDPVLRAIVEAVYPNSNGRSRYRYRRYRSGPQKMRESHLALEISKRIFRHPITFSSAEGGRDGGHGGLAGHGGWYGSLLWACKPQW